MREGAFYDHIKAKGIYTETGTPSLIILTNDTMYRTAGEDSIMNPSKSISLESAPDGSGISARAEIVTPLAKFVKQTCPSEATKMIQVINNLRGKKLLNAVWQEGYLQMILQVVRVKRPTGSNEINTDEPQQVQQDNKNERNTNNANTATNNPVTEPTKSPNNPPANPYSKPSKTTIQLMTVQRENSRSNPNNDSQPNRPPPGVKLMTSPTPYTPSSKYLLTPSKKKVYRWGTGSDYTSSR